MENCYLCPNACGVNRTNNAGICGVNDKIKIAKYYAHPFEEPPISGTKGSGTVFFSGCSLKCVFCQNFDVSRNKTGKEITVEELANIFMQLENQGVHNINFVNPTHYTNKIISALDIYRPSIPIVWNTHGYETIQTLEKINSYVDVYLPDIKYFSPETSLRYTGKKNYFEKASKAIEFMANKPYVLDKDGLLKSGTIVRHLILPQNVSDTIKILDWYQSIKDKTALSLMSQYTPFGEIEKFPELNRKLTQREYNKAFNYALSLGIENMFVQDDKSSSTKYIPTWDF